MTFQNSAAPLIYLRSRAITYNYKQMVQKIKRFFAEARQELRHVNWPTRGEAARLTGIVIGISIGLALFLGIFDFAFTSAVKNIVLRGTSNSESGIILTPEDIKVS